MMPPIASCQPASVSAGTGDCQRLSSTVATAMIAVAPKAASTPTGSRPCALGPSKSSNPSSTQSAAATVLPAGTRLADIQPMPITKTGAEAPIMAATLPGSRYAARNSSGKKIPKFNAARTAERHHQIPWGRRRVRSTMRRPTGSERTTESSSGRSGGSTWVVSR